MWSNETFARFEQALERDSRERELSSRDVVELADRHHLSLVQACTALDPQRWQRVYLDEKGQTVQPDVAARALAEADWSGHCPYRVAWRRAGPSSGYLLA